MSNSLEKIGLDWLKYTLLEQKVKELLISSPGNLINIEELYKEKDTINTSKPTGSVLLPVEITDDNIAVCNGKPIYEQLEGEPQDMFLLFKEYREMPNFGEARLTYNLYKKTGIKPVDLEVVKRMCSWDVRAKAYDNAEITKQNMNLQHRKLQLQLENLETFADLKEMAIQKLLGMVDDMKPKDALEVLKFVDQGQKEILSAMEDKQLEKLPFAKQGEGGGNGNNSKNDLAALTTTMAQLGLLGGKSNDE